MTKRTVLVGVLIVSLAIVLAGCAAAKPDAAATKDTCFQNMAFLQTEMNLVHADSGIYPKFADVVKTIGRTCPSGGTYSFDEKTGVVSCSIHGAYKP